MLLFFAKIYTFCKGFQNIAMLAQFCYDT